METKTEENAPAEEEVIVEFNFLFEFVLLSHLLLQEVVIIDPSTLVQDLYNAAMKNDTEECLRFLEMGVPPTYMDTRSGLTVRNYSPLTILLNCILFSHSPCIGQP
jgi:hypothetical protein